MRGRTANINRHHHPRHLKNLVTEGREEQELSIPPKKWRTEGSEIPGSLKEELFAQADARFWPQACSRCYFMQ